MHSNLAVEGIGERVVAFTGEIFFNTPFFRLVGGFLEHTVHALVMLEAVETAFLGVRSGMPAGMSLRFLRGDLRAETAMRSRFAGELPGGDIVLVRFCGFHGVSLIILEVIKSFASKIHKSS